MSGKLGSFWYAEMTIWESRYLEKYLNTVTIGSCATQNVKSMVGTKRNIESGANNFQGRPKTEARIGRSQSSELSFSAVMTSDGFGRFAAL